MFVQGWFIYWQESRTLERKGARYWCKSLHYCEEYKFKSSIACLQVFTPITCNSQQSINGRERKNDLCYHEIRSIFCSISITETFPFNSCTWRNFFAFLSKYLSFLFLHQYNFIQFSLPSLFSNLLPHASLPEIKIVFQRDFTKNVRKKIRSKKKSFLRNSHNCFNCTHKTLKSLLRVLSKDKILKIVEDFVRLWKGQ